MSKVQFVAITSFVVFFVFVAFGSSRGTGLVFAFGQTIWFIVGSALFAWTSKRKDWSLPNRPFLIILSIVASSLAGTIVIDGSKASENGFLWLTIALATWAYFIGGSKEQ